MHTGYTSHSHKPLNLSEIRASFCTLTPSILHKVYSEKWVCECPELPQSHLPLLVPQPLRDAAGRQSDKVARWMPVIGLLYCNNARCDYAVQPRSFYCRVCNTNDINRGDVS